MFIQQKWGESASGRMRRSWGNGARAKSVNHSISKINGMFWSSLPFVSAEWPVQRRAQQAGAEVSAVVDGYRRIMKQRPGLSATFSSAQPSCSERAGCQTRLLSPTSPEPQRQKTATHLQWCQVWLNFHPQKCFQRARRREFFTCSLVKTFKHRQGRRPIF